MSNIVIRKPPFRFEGVDFLWNPENPAFSALANSVSFQVMGFEKYICRAMRDAEKLIDDPAMLEECRLFNAQEMIHSRVHKRHADALIERYPGLQEVYDEAVADYDDLYRRHDLRFHLAYTANIEATFAPMFKLILNHRDTLMGNGDARVASTFIWHFCEEMEHRGSAVTVYDAVVGDNWYRLSVVRQILRHSIASANKILAGFVKHVPELGAEDIKRPLARVPWLARKRLSVDLLLSQSPWHNPHKIRVPKFYYEWRRRYEEGEDMTRPFGRERARQEAMS